MPINVSEALCSDTAETITGKRPGAATIVDGLQQAPTYATFKLLASVQQPSYAELQVLDEGERDKDIRKFICNKRVYAASDRDKRLSDYLVYGDNEYKVIYAGDWQAYGHTTVLAVRDRLP